MQNESRKSYTFKFFKGFLFLFAFLVNYHVIDASDDQPPNKRKFEEAFPKGGSLGTGSVNPASQPHHSSSHSTQHTITPNIPHGISTSEKKKEEESKIGLAIPFGESGLPIWFENISLLLKTFKEQGNEQSIHHLEQLYRIKEALPGPNITGVEPPKYWGKLKGLVNKGKKDEAIKILNGLVQYCAINIILETLHPSETLHKEVGQQYITPKDLPENDALHITDYDLVHIQLADNSVALKIRNHPFNIVGHPKGTFKLDGHIFTLQNVDGISMRCFFNAIGLVRIEEIKKLIANHNNHIVRYMIANEIVSAALTPEQIPLEVQKIINYGLYKHQMEQIGEFQEQRSAILAAQTTNPDLQDTSKLSHVHKNIGAISEGPLEDLRKRAFTLKAFNAFLLHYIGNDEMMVALQDVSGDKGGNINANYTSIDAIAYINNIGIKIYQQDTSYGKLRLAHQFIPKHATEIAYLYHEGNHFQAFILQQPEGQVREEEIIIPKVNPREVWEVIGKLNKFGALPGPAITGEEKFWNNLLPLIKGGKYDEIIFNLNTLKKIILGSEKQKLGIKDLEEGNKLSPIELFTLTPNNQLEEKWRWRNSFKLIFSNNSEKKPYVMDFSQIHQELSTVKKQVEQRGSKYMQTDTSNVLVPAITIVYETNKGELKHISGFLPYYNRNGIVEREYMVFLSGMGRTDFPDDVPTEIGKFHPTKGDSLLGMSDMQMKGSLNNLYLLSPEKDDPLNPFRLFILSIISNAPSFGPTNFGTYFNHSEQWFIYHLLSPLPGTFRSKYTGSGKIASYGNLCLSIINVLHASPDINDIKTIHEIIFHAESTHDICDVCSPTLAVFLQYLNNAKPQIIPLLKQIVQTYLNKTDLEVSEHMRFFMITSSYRADLGQASLREYYNNKFDKIKGDRRKYFGKDKITNLDQPIEIPPQIPYLYVQVPVDDHGIPLKSIEKK